MSETTVKITVPGNHLMIGLLGHRDQLLRCVEDAFPSTRILPRGNELNIEGSEADMVGRVFGELLVILEKGQVVDTSVVRRTIDMLRAGERPSEMLTAEVLKSARGRSVRPKTAGQHRYVEAMTHNIITFGIGPAGTGKSYLAVALAVQALHEKRVERVILTRPAVEAGERLGFLPGDLLAKIDPYLRPLYDALYDMVGTEAGLKLMARGAIEVAPLAFMRGRTLNNSFIILDEAQNTTPEQMKMFLTRIGENSKVVVTGDDTQVDLGVGKSGLVEIESILHDINDLAFVHLDHTDVVRHRIVQDIVNAYERSSKNRRNEGAQ